MFVGALSGPLKNRVTPAKNPGYATGTDTAALCCADGTGAGGQNPRATIGEI